MARHHLEIALVFVLAACSKKDARENATAGTASPASSVKMAVVSTRVDVALPPAVKLGAPKPKEIAGRRIVAEPCKLDRRGPEMKGDDSTTAIRGVVPSPDGALYVLDHEAKLRRYLVQSQSPCELQLDDKFGKGGIVEIPPDGAGHYDTLQIDPEGAVYLSCFSCLKIKRITPDGEVGVPTICSGDPFRGSRLIVDRTTGEMYSQGERLTRSGPRCQKAETRFEGWPSDHQPRPFDAANGQVLVAGFIDQVYKVGVHTRDGKRVAIVGGNGRDAINAATAQSCSLGLCVYDKNERKLRVWSGDGGSVLGAADLNELFGASTRKRDPNLITEGIWPVSLVVAKGAAWASFAQSDEDNKTWYGFVARITGLD